MAKHYEGCTCASCEATLEKAKAKLKRGVKRSIAYARYVEACQEAHKRYKDDVKAARDTYEREKAESETAS